MSSSTSNVQTKIQAAHVLQHELETLKSGRNVYVQQPGSLIFFKSDRDTALKSCQETIKSLHSEYQQLQTKMDVGP